MEAAETDCLSLVLNCRADGVPVPLSLCAARSVVISLLAAANHLQRNNLSHGDIKPENLLIFLDGAVKLADFGALQPASAPSGAIAGTVGYQSPELARAVVQAERQQPVRFQYIPEKADSWAVGITLFVLLAACECATAYQFLPFAAFPRWSLCLSSADERCCNRRLPTRQPDDRAEPTRCQGSGAACRPVPPCVLGCDPAESE